jgi:hypothetical protein
MQVNKTVYLLIDFTEGVVTIFYIFPVLGSSLNP